MQNYGLRVQQKFGVAIFLLEDIIVWYYTRRIYSQAPCHFKEIFTQYKQFLLISTQINKGLVSIIFDIFSYGLAVRVFPVFSFLAKVIATLKYFFANSEP